MSVLDSILSILAPFDCLGCGQEGALLCHSCSSRLSPAQPNCYRCQQANTTGLTCDVCSVAPGPRRVQAAFAYRAEAKSLIWKLKSAGARSAATQMAQLLLKSTSLPRGAIIVPIPTASSRVRQRGYDQATLLARALAVQQGLPYRSYLRRSGQAHQVGASRSVRQQQLAQAFSVKGSGMLRGAHIVLVDDVITTGATIEAAASVLLKAGAASIEAIAFTRA